MNQNYFDNAASTPVDPGVVQEMLPFLTEAHGNAHSIHSAGMRAMQAVERARERVAELIGAEDPDEVVFTSGATESNNWVLRSYGRLAISPFEHPSVAVTGACMGAEILGNDGEALSAPTTNPDLVSVMWVNNEMGGILDVPACRTWAKNVHSDLTQAVGKVPFDLRSICFGSLSAHKFYGPKGVGALYAHGGCNLDPLLAGGGQEHGARAGTLNVPGIVGMGAAAAIALEKRERDHEHATKLRAIVLEELRSVPDWVENRMSKQSPFVLNLSFLGLVGEALVVELDCMGYAVSAASACKSSHHGASGVLTALGLSPEWAKGALRVSFGRANTPASAQALGVALRESVEALRAMR